MLISGNSGLSKLCKYPTPNGTFLIKVYHFLKNCLFFHEDIQRAKLISNWRREFFSESWLWEFQPRLASQATCQTAYSRYVALCAVHAFFYTVKRLIVWWHAALFMLLHSRCGCSKWGQLWSWWFSCKFGLFISWQHTKVNHHIYKSQGKPSFIVFTRAWAEYNSWKAGGENTIFTVPMPLPGGNGLIQWAPFPKRIQQNLT